MKNNCLHTLNLSVGYGYKKGAKKVATAINCNLKPGKLIALIGQNGVGKSTLLRSLCALQKPLAGEIFVNNKPIQHYKANELAQQLSVVLTEKLPPSNLSVWELVALGRQPYTNWIGHLTALDRNTIAQAIAATNLTAIQHQSQDTLSDGQLQNALIARALAQETPLIILDEPTTHLDLLHKLKLVKLLIQLCEHHNKCILFSTHDIEMAMAVCDELLVMTPHKVTQGSAEQLINEGIIAKLFPDSEIAFDSAQKKFTFQL